MCSPMLRMHCRLVNSPDALWGEYCQSDVKEAYRQASLCDLYSPGTHETQSHMKNECRRLALWICGWTWHEFMDATRPDMVLKQALPRWKSKLFLEVGDRLKQHNTYIMTQKGSCSHLLLTTSWLLHILYTRQYTILLGTLTPSFHLDLIYTFHFNLQLQAPICQEYLKMHFIIFCQTWVFVSYWIY